MAMLGGECSACCGGGPCAGCNAPSWGSARRFVQNLASLNGTQYTGLSIISSEAQDRVFTVRSESGFAEFEGTRVYPPAPRISDGVNYARSSASSDSSGCVYGTAEVHVPHGGFYVDAEGSRYSFNTSDTRYPRPPGDGRPLSYVQYFEFKVNFNRQAALLSPNIVVYPPSNGFRFWNANTSIPLITSIRFGGKAITATPWDGVSEPTINNAIFGNAAEIFPSSNCKWRDSTTDPRRVLSVPDANYRGPLEIDWAIFRQFIAGFDDIGDPFAGYALADSGTVTVQWDDMTEFEGGEDCNPGACCEVDGSCNIKPQCECDTENGAVFAGVGETCEACVPDCIKSLGDNPPSAIRFRVTAPEERGPPWVSTDYPEGHFQPLRENGYSKVQEMVFDGFDIEFDVPIGRAKFAKDIGFLAWDIFNPVSTQTETSGVNVESGIGIFNNETYCSVGVRATQRRSGFAPFSGFYGIETKYLEFIVSFGLFGGRPVLELNWRSYWLGMSYSVPTSTGSGKIGPYLFERRWERKTATQEQVAGVTYSTTGNEGFDLIGSGSISNGGVYEHVFGSGDPFCSIPTWDRTTPAPEVGGTYSYMVGSTLNCRSPFYGTQRRVGSPSIVASATFLSANPLP